MRATNRKGHGKADAGDRRSARMFFQRCRAARRSDCAVPGDLATVSRWPAVNAMTGRVEAVVRRGCPDPPSVDSQTRAVSFRGLAGRGLSRVRVIASGQCATGRHRSEQPDPV